MDTVDNSRLSADMVTILIRGRDVAVRSVTSSKNIVARGYGVNITVTVKNYGIFVENFATAYANTTAIQT